jgi:hypothetical protein
MIDVLTQLRVGIAGFIGVSQIVRFLPRNVIVMSMDVKLINID